MSSTRGRIFVGSGYIPPSVGSEAGVLVHPTSSMFRTVQAGTTLLLGLIESREMAMIMCTGTGAIRNFLLAGGRPEEDQRGREFETTAEMSGR